MSIKITMPGALTTVQDAGRFGYQKSGIGTSGVMDLESYQKANYLVGNESGEAVLEFTLFGGAMELTEDGIIAITGADMEPTLNDRPIAMNQPVPVRSGDVLAFGMAKEGCRSYLAVAGGLYVPVVLGSRATNMKCRMGGYEGRPLKAGDEIAVGADRKDFDQIKDRRVKARQYLSEITVRVVEGPQAEYFTEVGKKIFYKETYTISDQIALGSVQVPADGRPIVLLADRQTTGGYAKIATVCSFDIPKLVQGRPGDRVRFVRISVEEAQKINRKRGI